MKEKFSYPVVSVIVFDEFNRVLIQQRVKPNAGVFNGFWELPQGKLRHNESIIDCAKRELFEETGMRDFSNDKIKKEYIQNELIEFSKSIIVCESGLYSYFAICVVGQANGTPKNTIEAINHAWVDKERVCELIDSDLFFPLNIPMLKDYFGIE